MTIDALVLGADVAAVGQLLSSRLFVLAVRNSIAKWMPASSRPGIVRSRGCVAPVAEQQRVVLGAQLLRVDVLADVGVRRRT